MGYAVAGGAVVGGGTEIWRYQYLTYPSSIFMADNRADMQLSHMSASVFITEGNRACK